MIPLNKVRLQFVTVRYTSMINHVLFSKFSYISNFDKSRYHPQKLEKGGVSSNDYPDQRYCSQIGVAWFLVFAEKHLSEFSVSYLQITMEYLICYTMLKLFSGFLKSSHFSWP